MNSARVDSRLDLTVQLTTSFVVDSTVASLLDFTAKNVHAF
jgi:hypothetical protein